jgi:hypothetical protein
LVLTGLRKGELASLTVSQVRLDGPLPHVELDAADEKNREGNGVVLRADLADDLRLWLADKLAALQADARRRGGPIPARLPADTPLFYVPDKLSKIFNRDLKAAGITKRDERDRTLDVHALRTTFGTLLSRGGVPLRTAQAAMRHADPSLTANVYTDPKLLDVAGALDALPTLPLGTGQNPAPEQARATGTETYGRSSVALPVALTHDKRGANERIPDKTEAEPPNPFGSARLVASARSVKASDDLTTPDNRSSEWAMQDLNLRPPACRAVLSGRAKPVKNPVHASTYSKGQGVPSTAKNCELLRAIPVHKPVHEGSAFSPPERHAPRTLIMTPVARRTAPPASPFGLLMPGNLDPDAGGSRTPSPPRRASGRPGRRGGSVYGLKNLDLVPKHRNDLVSDVGDGEERVEAFMIDRGPADDDPPLLGYRVGNVFNNIDRKEYAL